MVLNRMAGVIAALVTGDDIVIFREEIHHTAFALVPQLIPTIAVNIKASPFCRNAAKDRRSDWKTLPKKSEGAQKSGVPMLPFF